MGSLHLMNVLVWKILSSFLASFRKTLNEHYNILMGYCTYARRAFRSNENSECVD